MVDTILLLLLWAAHGFRKDRLLKSLNHEKLKIDLSDDVCLMPSAFSRSKFCNLITSGCFLRKLATSDWLISGIVL